MQEWDIKLFPQEFSHLFNFLKVIIKIYNTNERGKKEYGQDW